MSSNNSYTPSQDDERIVKDILNAKIFNADILNFLDSPRYSVKVRGLKEVTPIHFVDNEIGGKKRVDCTGDTETCEYCQNGSRPLYKYSIKVEDREDGQEKTLECGIQLFKAIKSVIIENPDVQDYYIKVEKHGVGRETRYTAEKVV